MPSEPFQDLPPRQYQGFISSRDQSPAECDLTDYLKELITTEHDQRHPVVSFVGFMTGLKRRSTLQRINLSDRNYLVPLFMLICIMHDNVINHDIASKVDTKQVAMSTAPFLEAPLPLWPEICPSRRKTSTVFPIPQPLSPPSLWNHGFHFPVSYSCNTAIVSASKLSGAMSKNSVAPRVICHRLYMIRGLYGPSAKIYLENLTRTPYHFNIAHQGFALRVWYSR
ncbi:hypothetical protein N431DRAFT_520941 [Stipitochalara longipes BDJ]|nr:hypothetical protein N431DRAFT_520941 [Stipitochalara longipes BDJ]